MTSCSTNSGMPPASVHDDRHAARLGLQHAATERLGRRGVDEHVEAPHHLRDVVSPTGERHPVAERPASARAEAASQDGSAIAASPTTTRPASVHRPGVGVHRVDQDLDPLARVDPADDADERSPGTPTERGPHVLVGRPGAVADEVDTGMDDDRPDGRHPRVAARSRGC